MNLIDPKYDARNTPIRYSSKKLHSDGRMKTPTHISTKIWRLLVLSSLFAGACFWVRFGTLQGVPVPIVWTFITDQTARDAYFSGERRLLHDRLNELGVEEEIAAYYRHQFEDEAELDWYIHQLMYDRTGYVGKAYKIGTNDTLVLKTETDRRFPQWFKLAQQVGLVSSHWSQNGIIYVTGFDGTSIPYTQISQIYTIKSLRQMLRIQKRKAKQQQVAPSL